MTKKMKRRDFMRNSAVAGLAIAAAKPEVSGFPMILKQSAVKPLVISSANGNKFKNGGPVTAVQKAFTMITEGADVLDSVIAGVNIVELDPLDDSVGYGGLPNAEGIVQLDSSCMHGPKKRAGAVGAIEGVRTPSLVAKAVLENTDHHLIVGKGAQDFARGMGFKIEDDLNTENSRRQWLEWKRRIDPAHYLDPKKRAEAGHKAALEMFAEGLLREENLHGTINCDGINSKGEICGVTTTSGLAWKIPGRLGDSPDSWCRPLRRRCSGCSWINGPRRSRSLQSMLVCDHRGNATRRTSQRCRHGSAESNQEQHGRKTAAE